DITGGARFIRRQVAELSARPDVDDSIAVHIERADGGIVGNANRVPANAIINQHTVVVADVDHTALVLGDGPVLRLRAVFSWRVVAEIGQAYLALILPRPAFSAQNEWQDRKQE